jgi:hypothetical protein
MLSWFKTPPQSLESESTSEASQIETQEPSCEDPPSLLKKRHVSKSLLDEIQQNEEFHRLIRDNL